MNSMNSMNSANRTSSHPTIRQPLLGAALLLLVGLLLVNSLRRPDHAAVGRQLDGMALEPLIGQCAALGTADLRGKVVLVNFWGPWCTYCQVEMPHLVDLYQRWRDHPEFQLLSVACSADMATESPQTLAAETSAYLEHRGYDFPVHWDPSGRSRRALLQAADRHRYAQIGFSYPTTLVLDRNVTIRGLWSGYAPGMEREIGQVIEQALQGTPNLKP